MAHIEFPDLSSHQGKMSIAGAVALSAKATEGTTFTDPSWAWYRDAAKAAGIPLIAYHFLRPSLTSNIKAQAAHAFAVVGAGVPLLIDWETDGNGGQPTLADVLNFAAAYRAAGGTVALVYTGQWYWKEIGSPDLSVLAAHGLALWVAYYTAYSDTGPGWRSFGGATPVLWQFTSSRTWNGVQKTDWNAWRGTVEELQTYFMGGATMITAKSVQTKAINLGYDVGKSGADGQIGPATLAALDKALDDLAALKAAPPPPDVAALTAERDKLAGQIAAARAALSA